jgi:hypothetical protein
VIVTTGIPVVVTETAHNTQTTATVSGAINAAASVLILLFCAIVAVQ